MKRLIATLSSPVPGALFRTLPIVFAWLPGIAFLVPGPLAAQDMSAFINPAAVEKVERVLSADDMQGRGTRNPGIEKAADYIESQFKAAGLQTWNKGSSYRQPFSMVASRLTSLSASLDEFPVPEASIIVLGTKAQLSVDEHSGYEKAYIRRGMSLFAAAIGYAQRPKNTLVLVDTSFAKDFARLQRLREQQFASDYSVLFILTSQDPSAYRVDMQQEITKEVKFANVVGILPGRSRKSEYVVFSGHYDHLGIGEPDKKGDSIYNGANDDASGCTAVITLARYFASRHDNERTLIFATFTAEEIGGFGSKYFSLQLDPAAVAAMFNIEMIGTESKWGTNSAYITGYERTDMGVILQKNLQGSKFRFYPDPYPEQSLFFRSDNATLARQGVPAHTLSTSKMDSEKYYHTQGDEISTLDMNNMAEIIKSIAISSASIIAGKDSPTRVDTESLK